MDHYGIGQAMAATVQIYRQTSRATGRTVSLVESVKNGDRVVFTNEREAKRVAHLCAERGVEISTMVVDPRSPEKLFHSPPAVGRSIFDHSWVEEFYGLAVAHAAEEIDMLERESSGLGEAHRETRRRAVEASRFRSNLPP